MAPRRGRHSGSQRASVGRRLVAVRDAEAPADVNQARLQGVCVAELAEPAHDALEHAGIVHLRAEVHVQAAPVELRVLAGLEAGARCLGRRQAELRALVGGRDLLVPAGEDARRDAHGDGLAPAIACRHGGHASALVQAVQHQQSAARRERGIDVGVGLAVAVDDDAGRVDAGTQGRGELSRTGDVGTQPAAAQQPQHAHGAARLAGERDVRVGMLARRRRGRRPPRSRSVAAS